MFEQVTTLCRRGALVAGIASATLLTGCMTMYVDGATQEVPSSSFRKPAALSPTQVVFEYQVNGIANAQSTAALKPQVLQQLRDSGLFSRVEETPVPGGALLTVKLNNVPITEGAFGKGMVTGLTFGLVGSQATDGYACTVNYVRDGMPAAVEKTAQHSTHATFGAASEAPANAYKAESAAAASAQMTSQVLSTALYNLSQDPAFPAR